MRWLSALALTLCISIVTATPAMADDADHPPLCGESGCGGGTPGGGGPGGDGGPGSSGGGGGPRLGWGEFNSPEVDPLGINTKGIGDVIETIADSAYGNGPDLWAPAAPETGFFGRFFDWD
jgi:hypothetical protein